MKLWKALGVAGLAGVATTGVILARNQRARAQLTPEEVRERLHRRLEELDRAEAQEPADGPGEAPGEGPADDPGSTDSSARA